MCDHVGDDDLFICRADTFSGCGKTYQQVLLGRAVSGVGSAGKIALTSVVVAGTLAIRRDSEVED